MTYMKAKRCPICKKEIRGFNNKQLDWNYYVHVESCKRKQKKKQEE